MDRPTPLHQDLDDDAWLAQAREALAPGNWDQIGDYRILGEISRGGQGVVLKAEAPDGRVVAIKRLLAGTLTGTRGRLRLEREMEIAARLMHPGIVRLQKLEFLERQPILVMDWIDGISPLHWARPKDQPARPAAEIVQLLLDLCSAMQHAHQRGVIHRDLKPSNLLVDHADVLHVLDFGIAKVLQEVHSEQVDLTRTEEFLGSPGYAPPERLLHPESEADTRDDIYAIGVLAFELLSGQQPYELGGSLVSAIRAMQEQSPRDLQKLAPEVPRDLAMIVHRAIDRDRDRRYPSAVAMADDLRRFQEGRPVLARAPHALYLLSKAMKRNPLVSALSLALLVAVLGFSWYAWDQAQDLRAEKDLAREALAYVTEDVLPLLDPSLKGSMSTMSEVLQEASATVGERFHAEPALEREVRLALAHVQLQHGHPIGARANLQLASALPVDWASSQQEAEFLLLESDAALQTADWSGAESALQRASTMANIDAWSPELWIRKTRLDALLLAAQGRHAEAIATLETLCEELAEQQNETALWRATLWQIPLLRQAGRAQDAATLAEELVQQAQSRFPGQDHLDLAEANREWGWSLFHSGKITDAMDPLHKALSLRTTLLGESHPDVAQSLVDVATWQQFQHWQSQDPGILTRIKLRLERAAEILRRTGGGHHASLAGALVALGGFAEGDQMMELAQNHYQEAVSLLEARVGVHHPVLLEPLTSLAQALSAGGDHAAAREHFQRAESLLQGEKDDGHGTRAHLWMAEARNEEAAGEPAAALAFYEKAEASLSGGNYVSTPLKVCRERIAALKLEIAQ